MKHIIKSDDEIVQQVASNLRSFREGKKMTQSEVAESASISVNHYAKIERGEVEPGEVTLVRLISSLGAEYTDILP